MAGMRSKQHRMGGTITGVRLEDQRTHCFRDIIRYVYYRPQAASRLQPNACNTKQNRECNLLCFLSYSLLDMVSLHQVESFFRPLGQLQVSVHS